MNEFICGDALTVLKALQAESINCVVTSPPYWGLRDYGIENQLGLEPTPELYVEKMVEIFREIRHVLKKDGTLWVNLGDSYAQDKKWGGYTGGKHAKGLHGKTGIGRNRHKTNLCGKNLVGIPWRVALALQADGWYLRQDIIWHKPNPMPESVNDRCTKAHEYIFLLTKSAQYYYNNDAIREKTGTESDWETYEKADGRTHSHEEDLQKGMSQKKPAGYKALTHPGGRNKRSVWTINTESYSEAEHFATFPQELPEICIKAGCPAGGTVLDPFCGSGTTIYVARRMGLNWKGIDLNPEYIKLAKKRNAQEELFK